MLGEFNKAQIHRHIEPMLTAALATGVTPFLDLIISSPHSSLEDVAVTLREAYRWLRQGCEIGMYPYVIPFSGAAFAKDPELAPYTHYAHREIAGTPLTWEQPAKILPIDPEVAATVLLIEQRFEALLHPQERSGAHLPSRLRSLLWILASLPVLGERGHYIGDEREVRAELLARMPALEREAPQYAAAIA